METKKAGRDFNQGLKKGRDFNQGLKRSNIYL